MKTINVGEVTVFDHVEPNKEQALKPLEEAAEVFGAWQEWNETKSLSDEGRVIEEIADTIQACVNLAAAMGVGGLAYAMVKCKIRNIKRGRITEENPEALDADGAPIEVGDELYLIRDIGILKKGMALTVGDIRGRNNEGYPTFICEENKSEHNPLFYSHRKPDSWEQLEEDLKLGSRHYCDRRKIIREGRDSLLLQKQDIIRRAKALAGVKDE